MLEKVLNVQDQKTAVGLVQAARLDQGEVRDQRAHFRLTFHTAQQINRRGVVLHHNGRAVLPAVVHQQVDFVAVENVFHGRQGVPFAAGLPRHAVARQKGFGVFEDIFAQGREIVRQPRHGAGLQDALLRRSEQGVQHLGHGLAFQVAFIVVKGFLGLVQLAHETGHGLHQTVAPTLEVEAHRIVQALELLFAQALAFYQRVEGQAAVFVHVQIETLMHGHRVHLVQQTDAHVLELVHQLGSLLDVGCGLKTPGQLFADVFQCFFQGLLELFTLSGGQGQQAGAVRVREVLHIDQIRRRRSLARLGTQIGKQHIAAAEVRFAGKIYVVTGCADLQGQVQSLHGPWLEGILAAVAVARQRNGPAVLPGNAGRIKRGVQPGGGQRCDAWHKYIVLTVVGKVFPKWRGRPCSGVPRPVPGPGRGRPRHCRFFRRAGSGCRPLRPPVP